VLESLNVHASIPLTLQFPYYRAHISYTHILLLGHAVAQLVETLCYKPEGREFNSQCGHWIFQLI
jgi:hypothetical protein